MCGFLKDFVDIFYNIWMKKYMNVTFKDRLVGLDIIDIVDSNKLTTKTQNIRDSLLRDHVKNKN